MAHGVEDVVGGVHGVEDGLDAECGEAIFDDAARVTDRDIAEDAGGEAAAEGGLGDFDREGRGGFRGREMGCERRKVERVDGGGFAGDTVVVHGVNAVGGDVHLEDGGGIGGGGDGFDSDAAEGEVVGEGFVVNRDSGEKFAEPGGEDLHAC